MFDDVDAKQIRSYLGQSRSFYFFLVVIHCLFADNNIQYFEDMLYLCDVFIISLGHKL